MVNFWERYLGSKGSPESLVEDPPQGNLAAHADLEENASHHDKLPR